jgi:hypothetical protein
LLIFNVRGSTGIGGDEDGNAEENSPVTRNEDGDEEEIWGQGVRKHHPHIPYLVDIL